MSTFTIAPTPELHFGAGKISVIPNALKRFGPNVLLVTGENSFDNSPYRAELLSLFDKAGVSITQYKVGSEPDPAVIDEAVSAYAARGVNVVVGIGGGSVLDAAKAISAMLPIGEGVRDYLEGVGRKIHPGTKIPFIAIPTTSGTGSESTKNAVISEVGAQGFKRSLRHNNFVPDIAIVDPALTISCPPSVTSASGMDAFTQLLESYLSTASNPVTDALAVEGLRCISRSLLKAYTMPDDIEARSDMSLAAYLSGVTLANAGLGLVHGFASSIGGFFSIAHGVICSSLMPSANKVTVRRLKETSNTAYLIKYAEAGKLFCADTGRSREFYISALLDHIGKCHAELGIPKLRDEGIEMSDMDRIVSVTDNKNNPAILDREEIREVLELAL